MLHKTYPKACHDKNSNNNEKEFELTRGFDFTTVLDH